MSRLLVFLLFLLVQLPAAVKGQNKRQSRKAAAAAQAQMLEHLQNHVHYLASDALEGRRTGTAGEALAVAYLVDQYQKAGIAAAGAKGYTQVFDIQEGKQALPEAFLEVNGKKLNWGTDYFALANSGAGRFAGKAVPALTDPGQPWCMDVKEALEENAGNPHFDIEQWIKATAQKAAAKKATALVLYNSSKNTDNIQFNKNDRSTPLPLPVFYVLQPLSQQVFADPTASLTMSGHAGFTETVRQGTNVAAWINNNAPTTIVLGAHLDHLGYGEDKNALDTGKQVHNGADDNASGTAALLELAKALKKQSPVQHNYLFLHFSGEELGLLGSKYWLEHPTLSVQPTYMLNMDMVGRYDTARKLTIGGWGTSPLWGQVLPPLAQNLAYKIDSAGSGPSDHASFYRKDIPVLFFFTGSHLDYHKATDDWDKINYAGLRDIVNLAYNLVLATADKGKIAFTKTAEQQMGRSTRFTVSLGVIPDYGYTGTGMRIDGVSPGKLAEKLGLQAGDVLLQLGEYKFVDVNAYMQSLSKFKKGDATTLLFKRGEQVMEKALVF